MDEKTKLAAAPSRPPPSYQCVRPRPSSYSSSCYSGDNDLDVYQAISSSTPPSNPFDSVEYSVQPEIQKRKRLAVWLSISLAVIIVSLVTGLLIWHFHDGDTADSSAPSGTNTSSVNATATRPIYTDHGPEMLGPITSGTITYASTETITPAAFTVTMTTIIQSTSF